MPFSRKVKHSVHRLTQKVTVLMEDSRHACGLTLDNGMELLLHVGIDTVDMKGDGFEYLVKEGEDVTQEPLLLDLAGRK